MKMLLTYAIACVFSLSSNAQTFTEILGRPTDHSITMSILFNQSVDVYWEYGQNSGNYNQQTATFHAQKAVPLEAVLDSLATNTKYYYRTRYRIGGSASSFLAGTEHTFETARRKGSTFTFAIEADPHMDANSDSSAYALTLKNILAVHPDFLIDLGDNFMSEKLSVINQENITSRHLMLRNFYAQTCHSVPLFLVIGNHEGEQGWRLDGTPNSMPVLASNTRKLYFPNPLPDSFYSGDTKEEPFVGLRQNYYAFEWGDVLIVVLDPYWYTVQKPDWSWTLGEEQYNWFEKTITESKAKYKFVFSHQLVGGNGNTGRGGTEFADFFEMGGNNSDGTWGWDTFRPEWEKPIHQLMLENKVNAFFHGHDHFFGKQEKDGIIYQEVPQPSNKNIKNTSAAEYGYVDGVFLPGRGFLKVTVSEKEVKVDYIQTYLPQEETDTCKNGKLAYSYTINSQTASAIEEREIAPSLQLKQNFPNPFSQETTIQYSIPETGQVSLKIYNALGCEIKQLVNQSQQAGTYSVKYDIPGDSGFAGLLFCRLTMGNYSKSIKLLQYEY